MFTNFPNGVTSFGIPMVGSLGSGVPNGNGQVLFVDSTGAFSISGNPFFTKIQDAINECSSGAGSTIFVFPGTYTENLEIDADALSIIGCVPAGYNRPDIVPTTGVASATQGQGFNALNLRFSAQDSDCVQQHGNGFFYGNCVFDGTSGQSSSQASLRLVGAVDDSHTASEGIVTGSLFRGSTSGIGLAFQYALAAAGGTGTTDNQIVGNRFYSNGVDIKSLTNTNGGGAGILLNTLIANNQFLTVGASYVYMNFAAGAAGDLAANSGLISGNYFADLSIAKTQIAVLNNPKLIVSGNFDATGVINGSGFNS